MSRVVSYIIEGTDRISGTLSNIATSFRAFLGVQAVQGISHLVRSSVQYVSAIKDAGEATGLATDNFQALALAASENGVRIDSLTQALMRVRDLQGSVGTDERAQKAFARLGLTIRDVASSSPDQLLKRIASAIASTGDSAAAFDIFGRGAGRLLSTLKELNSADWAGLKEKFSGLIISQQDIQTIDDAADKLERLGTALKVLGARGVVGLVQGPSALGSIANMTGTVEGWDSESKLNFWHAKRKEELDRQAKLQSDRQREASVRESENARRSEAMLFSRSDSGAYDMQITFLEQKIEALRKEREALGFGQDVLEKRSALTETIIEQENRLRGVIRAKSADLQRTAEEDRRAAEVEAEAARAEAAAKEEATQKQEDLQRAKQEERDAFATPEQLAATRLARIKEITGILSGVDSGALGIPADMEAKLRRERTGLLQQQKADQERQQQDQARAAEQAAERARKAQEARERLAELRKPSSTNIGISELFDVRAFAAGRSPQQLAMRGGGYHAITDGLSGPLGGTGRLVRGLTESASDFAERRAASKREAMALMSPEEQLVAGQREANNLLKVIADNVVPPKR